VEFQISKTAYEKYKAEVYQANDEESKGISMGQSLKSYLKAEIEKILTEEHKNETDPEKLKNQDVEEIKVAAINFAFNNKKLMELLRKRGGFITQNNFEKMREVEQEINQLKNEEYETFIRPVTAFITFQDEDGFNRACEHKKRLFGSSAKHELLYQPMYFSPATEPTNIIWENRQHTNMGILKRTVISSVVIVLLLLVSFIIIFLCKKKSSMVNDKYPPVNCDGMVDLFGDKLQSYALQEYEGYYVDKTETQLTGTL